MDSKRLGLLWWIAREDEEDLHEGEGGVKKLPRGRDDEPSEREVGYL